MKIIIMEIIIIKLKFLQVLDPKKVKNLQIILNNKVIENLQIAE